MSTTVSTSVSRMRVAGGVGQGRQAPGPQPKWLVGHLPEMQRRGQLQFFVDMWQQYGDTVRLQMGPLAQHLIVHPDDVRQVLVTGSKNYCKGIGYRKVKLALGNGLFVSEGEQWQQQRRLLQPAFTAKGILPFVDTMTAVAQETCDRWASQPRGVPLDVNQEMMRLAMDVISRTMFSVSVGAEAAVAGRAFAYVLEFVARRSVAILDWPMFVPTPANRRFREAMRTLDEFLRRMVDERRRDPNPPQDLLTTLIRARDDQSGRGMTEAQLRDEVITIFFAGHETTAQALTWAWYCISQYPEVEERLHGEVDAVLGGRLPEVDDVPRLAYTRMVVEETMRLYPPILMFARDAIEDDTLGGYNIPGGSMVVMSQYLTQRHPDWWDDPLKFEPLRFTPAAVAARPHYAYFPFGGGARTCLGDKFAMLEATLVLATIAQRYGLRHYPGHRVEPAMMGTLRPKYGMQMTATPRAT